MSLTQVLAALPTPVDLRLYAGNDFTCTLTVTDPAGAPFDLTGYTVLAQVRDASGTLLATFSSSISTNVVTLSLTKAQTAAVTVPALWDATVTDPVAHRASTLAAGDVTVTPAVSV